MTPAEPGQPAPTPTPPKRDWIAIMVTALPGLAALIAVTFTYVSVKSTENQVQIARQGQNTAQQGQITDRYNAAITNLGSPSIDIRLGGIYALQRLMQDSPRDQPTIIAVLCAFVRDSTMPTRKPHKPPTLRPPTDIQAALTVVGTRKTANDGHATVVDLDLTQLDGTDLSGAHLSGADLTGAHLSGAHLTGADLSGAFLTGAHLTGAYLFHADLSGADLTHADLTGAYLNGADLNSVNLGGADLTGAFLGGADLTGANLGGADLTGAFLGDTGISGANFTGAHLSGAFWPPHAAVPKGWLRETGSGLLHRPGT